MTKNALPDLNDHLFAQIERLGDEDLKDDALEKEIKRSQAVANIAKNIVNGAALQLAALRLRADYNGLKDGDIPKQIGLDK